MGSFAVADDHLVDGQGRLVRQERRGWDEHVEDAAMTEVLESNAELEDADKKGDEDNADDGVEEVPYHGAVERFVVEDSVGEHGAGD